jgi:hypothetical protein
MVVVVVVVLGAGLSFSSKVWVYTLFAVAALGTSAWLTMVKVPDSDLDEREAGGVLERIPESTSE